MRRVELLKKRSTTRLLSVRHFARGSKRKTPLRLKHVATSGPRKTEFLAVAAATTGQTQMGTVLGKIGVETPKYELVNKGDGFEVREYAPGVAAEVSYDPAEMKSGRDGGFSLLAGYIGAIGKPKNEATQKIAMTAPVITTTTKASDADAAAANAAVMETKRDDGRVTMQFVLPTELSMESAPRPSDERVRLVALPKRKFGVLGFSGVASEAEVKSKVELLCKKLAGAGYKISGDYLLARYNPPWTPGFSRTNEVMLPIE